MSEYFSLAEDPDAEPEPEIDISSFLAKQRAVLAPETNDTTPVTVSTAPSTGITLKEDDDDDDVDHTLSHLLSSKMKTSASSTSKARKGKQQEIEWDSSMEQMAQEKSKADAVRGTYLSFSPFIPNQNQNFVL